MVSSYRIRRQTLIMIFHVTLIATLYSCMSHLYGWKAFLAWREEGGGVRVCRSWQARASLCKVGQGAGGASLTSQRPWHCVVSRQDGGGMVERRRSLPNISFSTRDSNTARVPGGAEARHRPNTDRLIKGSQDGTAQPYKRRARSRSRRRWMHHAGACRPDASRRSVGACVRYAAVM